MKISAKVCENKNELGVLIIFEDEVGTNYDKIFMNLVAASDLVDNIFLCFNQINDARGKS